MPASFRDLLSPAESLAEILFGLVMVLTFTLGAGFAVEDGEGAVHQLLVAALGCNLAWGLIDGVFYVMGNLFRRHRDGMLIQRLQRCESEGEALALIRRGMQGDIDDSVGEVTRARFYTSVLALIGEWEPSPGGLQRGDLLGGAAVFGLVFGAALPAAVPFLVFDDAHLALRVSNAVLLTLLLLVGYRWGQLTGARPWLSGIAMLAVGLTLVGVAIALGG